MGVIEPESAPEVPPTQRIGTIISGRYRIESLLGEGGMGAVYLAEHTSMRKRVALKLLHADMGQHPDVVTRFEREAMAASHISHVHVAGATDFGKTEDGILYLVLEYVEGTNLRDAVGAAPSGFPVVRSLRIARQMSLALEAAHEAGIVHRDLKPENVMLVAKGDDPDFVKVLDFGIAKISDAAMAERGTSNTPITRAGTILGTPEYMSPEQGIGDAVTHSADLYALGVMMFEMLTGKLPFDPPDRFQMISHHIVAPLPPMIVRAPDVEIPPSVEALVKKLLAKDPKDRYPNARALIEAIDAEGTALGLDVGGGPSASAPPPLGPVDAFAQTTHGTPAPSRRELEGRTTALEIFRGLSHRTQMIFAAAVPLAIALVIVVIVIAVVSGKRPITDAAPDASASVSAAPVPTTAPDARVDAAAGSAPALSALSMEFPKDLALARRVPFAWASAGKPDEAMKSVRSLLAVDDTAASDPKIIELVKGVAEKETPSEADEDAYALLEGPLGAKGVDALIELAPKRFRAQKSLGKPDVRAHASPASSLLIDMRDARTCQAKRDLMPSAKDVGDQRALPFLKQLRSTTGCGILKRFDCWGCLRKDNALEAAIEGVEARVSK